MQFEKFSTAISGANATLLSNQNPIHLGTIHSFYRFGIAPVPSKPTEMKSSLQCASSPATIAKMLSFLIVANAFNANAGWSTNL
jgi:hypothetical protein